MSTFSIDPSAAGISVCVGIICYGLYRYKQTFSRPRIYVSRISSFDTTDGTLKERLRNLPNLLYLLGFLFLLLAIMDPKLHTELKVDDQENRSLKSTATEGIAIYFVLDRSGSMEQEITVRKEDGSYVTGTKVDLLRQATIDFIEGNPKLKLKGRPNDLIGIVEFARTASVIVPLTLDHKSVLDALEKFDVVKDPSQDGTAIGYAVLKTARLIAATRDYARDLIGKGEPAYEIKNSAIVLVTDGFQDPNREDKNSRWRQMDPMEAAQAIKELGIHVYIVNIEPTISSEDFAPHRRLLQKAAEATGGKFFTVGTSGSGIGGIYQSIDKIEKSVLPIDEDLAKALRDKIAKENLPGLYKTFYFAPYLIAFCMLSLMLGLLLESTLLRQVP